MYRQRRSVRASLRFVCPPLLPDLGVLLLLVLLFLCTTPCMTTAQEPGPCGAPRPSAAPTPLLPRPAPRPPPAPRGPGGRARALGGRSRHIRLGCPDCRQGCSR